MASAVANSPTSHLAAAEAAATRWAAVAAAAKIAAAAAQDLTAAWATAIGASEDELVASRVVLQPRAARRRNDAMRCRLEAMRRRLADSRRRLAAVQRELSEARFEAARECAAYKKALNETLVSSGDACLVRTSLQPFTLSN